MKEFQYNFFDEKKSVRKDICEINLNRLPVVLVLDGLTNDGNIGMIFRIADALRLKKIYFYNYDKNIIPKSLHKKSRATIKYVPFEYINNFEEILELKKKYEMIILDKTNQSISYNKFKYSKPVCLIIGNEETCVSEKLIEISDFSLHLPMNGINTSINVATAASVVLYSLYFKTKIQVINATFCSDKI